MTSVFKPSDAEPELLRKLYQDGNTLEAMADWIPATAIVGAAGGVNLPEMVRHHRSVLHDIDGPDGTDLWTLLTETLQQSIRLDLPGELEKWGGNGMFFTLHSVRMVSFIPIPEFSIGFGVSDTAGARSFTRALEQRIISEYEPAIGQLVDVELPGGYTYSYVPVPMLAGVQPGWSLIDNVLVFGTSASGVTDLLLARTEELARFFDSPEFETLLSEDPGNMVLCKGVYPDRLARTGHTILDSLSLFIVAADKDPAVYREILDTVATIPGIGVHMHFTDTFVRTRAAIEMP